ncbi:hypothetical protein SKAU_G00080030 [Synaphobranchus kaupii]|uniref:Uncharacterized protein n=1 Tax=Synaphobranchus kaupii TaxID=118154 RepID=A0A9Q1FVG6_SYNKA|nr:hypothetical protein SKAU_G00080030 [Synaphobranchus kaupii]
MSALIRECRQSSKGHQGLHTHSTSCPRRRSSGLGAPAAGYKYDVGVYVLPGALATPTALSRLGRVPPNPAPQGRVALRLHTGKGPPHSPCIAFG